MYTVSCQMPANLSNMIAIDFWNC